MRIDTAFVAQVLPIVRQLAIEHQAPQWKVMQGFPSLRGVLENGRVVEQNNRPLTFEEWTVMWANAASGQPNEQRGIRQRFMSDNMLTSIKHLDELAAVLIHFNENAVSLGMKIETRVRSSLPREAVLPASITMVLGTTSSGYVDANGIYIDLVALYMFHGDTRMTENLLTHESWHFGHGSLLEVHPHRNEPWFMPLAQLQSEGIVNFLVGGTHELNQYRAQHSDGEVREQSRRFLEYFDTMEDQSARRLNELFSTLVSLLSGDVESYTTYVASLPDMPGYLHGVYMSRKIHEVFGRDALVRSASDPMSFILLSIEALKRQRLDPCVPSSALQQWAALTGDF